jgi:hypothetical protein
MNKPLNTDELQSALNKASTAKINGFLDLTRDGAVRVTAANTRNAISKLGIDCRYDIFRDRYEVGGQVINAFAGELSDNACVYLRKLIEEQYEFDPGREKILDAAIQECLKNRYDPIIDYLDGLKWDGVSRINSWLTDYAGAELTDLNCAISRITLIAQVRRARQPGAKFDQIPVLEGTEGTGKSTLLAALAGSAAHFSDQTILGLSDRDQQERLRGVWVYEIADLTNVSKAEVEHVKAFASRTEDRARPAYGRTMVNLPRRCVIWATTNNHRYLRSQTGNRRFWPIETGRILLEDFKRDRDQLLAEAAVKEAEGESIVLPRELWSSAAEEQEQRREVDPWEDALADLKGTPGVSESGEQEERILTTDILLPVLGMPIDRQTDYHLKRLGSAMRQLGWAGPKVMRVGGKRGRGYHRGTGARVAGVTGSVTGKK